MAKTKFDRAEIIEKSKELFWQHGYSHASMQQVIKTTGLQPGSIYNSFGSKEALYAEALDNYTWNTMRHIKERIETAPSVGIGICRILENLIQQSLDKEYKSCFLIKTQFEIPEHESELHNTAVSGLERVEELLRSYLVREYGEDLGETRASSVMLHMNGIRVYSYRKNGADKMRRALRAGLPWLPWDSLKNPE